MGRSVLAGPSYSHYRPHRLQGRLASHWLKRSGAELAGFSLEPPSSPNLFSAAAVGGGVLHVIGDIRDRPALDAVMAEFEPEVVFHLAAQPLVRASYAAPEETYAVNVLGTLNVLQAAKAAKVRALVNVTTDKCYENREWLWGYREDEPLGGHDPYSASKACVEILSASFRKSFLIAEEAMRMATARAGNVLGGGDWGLDRLVPDMMRAFAGGEPVTIRNPAAIRPWQHVLDALSGYLMLGHALMGEDGRDYCQAWNFGPDRESEQNVGAVSERVRALWGDDARIETLPAHDGPHEARFLKLDSSKARALLHWRPAWSFQQVLEETVAWYRRYYAGGRAEPQAMAALMDDQIDAYTAGRLGHQASYGAERAAPASCGHAAR